MIRIEERFEPFPLLETERMLLRKITHADIDDMFEYGADPVVSKYTTWERHRTKNDTKAFIDFVIVRYKQDKVAPWGIVLKDTGKFIGSCSFVNWDNKNRKVELAYVLSRAYWRQGYMTEAVKRLIQFGFEELDLVRVEARCHPDNVGSAGVMAKSGMSYEGLLRKHIWSKGQFEDVKLYSIIIDEYSDQREERLNKPT